ncbi:hypothetical protein JZ751_007425 [Albula glossodonta]|uniref:Uncharacterized protein n=1 Tax=Albula glossodonta TaxID=121402 RepID=A0A8T2N362_9TELE|nr:hypothetical protein JZ751_007425 [Albula glossodonta]
MTLIPASPDSSSCGVAEHFVRCQAVQAENVTVLEGGTAQISCRLQNYDGSIVVIQNPRRQTLFFNGTREWAGLDTLSVKPRHGPITKTSPSIAKRSFTLPSADKL